MLIVGKWDSEWKSRSLTLILVLSSLLHPPSTIWVIVPVLDVHEHIPCMDCHITVLYSIGETELLYDLGTNGYEFCIAKSEPYIIYQFGFMIFPGNLLLLWEDIKLEAVSVVKKGRLVPPDVKAPRNVNKTKQTITTAKIKIMRDEKKDQH